MKKIINLLIIFTIIFNSFALFIKDVNASSYIITVTDKDGINVRKGAGTNYSTAGVLNYKAIATLISTTKYSGTGCSDGWYKISYNGSTSRYICSTYVKVSSTTSSSTITSSEYYTMKSWNARINENMTNVRSGPSTSYSIKNSLYLGTDLQIIESANNSWYKVKYYDGKIGYVNKAYVDLYDDITKKDEDYNKILKEAGFPESYFPYLTYLHEKYPNWKFKAVETNKYFDTAVDKEIGRNYTQSTLSSYRESNTLKEKPNWYSASASVVAFYLDPRNYLNEKNIFVFEDLSYDKDNHTSDILSSIFEDTYLDTKTYIGYFMEAAQNYKISPIHLAARVKQEGGTDKKYDGVSGTVSTVWDTKTGYICSIYAKINDDNKTGETTDSVNMRKNSTTSSDVIMTLPKGTKMTFVSTEKYESTGGCANGWYKVKVDRTLEGIYNYYNIGAYGTNPVVRGLATAAGYVDDLDGTPWNTRKKAIQYGAKFIADGYINVGQSTLYFQKFNTGPNTTYSAYTHQYMTNVTAPTSEANSAYNAYSDLKIMNKSLSFSIPVYKNMPNDATALPPIGNTNNNLSTIKINDENIENFDEDVISYTKYIDSETTEVKISATPEASTSQITGTGTIKTPTEQTIVNIVVTPEVGITKTYKITLIKVKKEEPQEPPTTPTEPTTPPTEETPDIEEKHLTFEEILNKIDIRYSNNYLSGLTLGTTTTTLTNMIQKIEPNAKVVITTSNKNTKTGKLTTGDILSITTNNETKNITISIKGETNGDSKITSVDLFRIQKHILGYSKLSGAQKEACDTNYDGKINSVDLFRTQKHILKQITLK